MVAAIDAAGDSFQVGKAETLFEGSFRGGMFGIGFNWFDELERTLPTTN